MRRPPTVLFPALFVFTLLAGSMLAGTTVRAAHAPVGLGTADSFAVLAGSTVTNTGPSVVNGDLGVSPGSAVVGFPPGIVNGMVHAADAAAAQAQADLTIAYDDAAGRPPTQDLTGSDLGGLRLTDGTYSFATSAQLTGTVEFDAEGDPNAVFIVQIGSTLTTASASSVSLINGADACNIFWQVGSSATLGTDTAFRGNILALTSITLDTGATIEDGRALARNGAVTLDTNVITGDTCAAADAGAITVIKAVELLPGDPDSAFPLPGVGFTLFDAECEAEVSQEAFTDDAGVIVFADIEVGAYCLVETTPLDGFREIEPILVEITEEEPDAQVEVLNEFAFNMALIKLNCTGIDEAHLLVLDADSEEPDLDVEECEPGEATFSVTGTDTDTSLVVDVVEFELIDLVPGSYEIREIAPNEVGPVAFEIGPDDLVLALGVNPVATAPAPTETPAAALPDTRAPTPSGDRVPLAWTLIVALGVAAAAWARRMQLDITVIEGTPVVEVEVDSLECRGKPN